MDKSQIGMESGCLVPRPLRAFPDAGFHCASRCRCKTLSLNWILSKVGKRHPDVDDSVTIYPDSTILGGETVIGANVFFMQSVPANSLLIYEERQLIIRNKAAKKKAAEFDYAI